MSEKIANTRRLCLEQAEGFIRAAEHLNKSTDWPHLVYHLSLLALEEVGKASIVSATAIKRADSDNSWIIRSLGNHRRKLQWAIWSPFTRIDPKDFEAAWQFADRAHAMRLASLYVDAEADETQPPPKDQIRREDAEQALALADARLMFELNSPGPDEKVVDELTEWFLEAMANHDQARRLLSPAFRAQFELLGGDARAWVRWARGEIARLDRETSDLLKAELAKPGAPLDSTKPKWRANATVYTPSHSLRAKVLARWNERVEPVQLLWSGRKDELTLQITLHDNRPLQDLFGRLTSLAKLTVACISIGSLGYFWFQRPGFQQRMFKEIRDLEHDGHIAFEHQESFWGDGRAVALTDEHIDHAIHCMMAFGPLPENEAEPIFAPYFNGLAMIAKSDMFFRFDDLARQQFVHSLAGALRQYGGWIGESDEFEDCLHRCFTPFMPERTHRDQLFRALRTQGDPSETSLVNLRTAKHLADLFLVHTARRTWKSILSDKPVPRQTDD